ncbi:hypothetical protein SELMODRAFT_167855 [Selaginella moellendorffii]|uniref:Plastocyanin n=1 Tax=Selaginella moellendorffii TaxID=88036 RepID=D8R485_SELML|nr:plastocyanin [Selaginella moellendorffii]XP_002989267.1 plastocyanin [Selaginella moellendorffii]EFJ09705.1 hypothetical protein SELMODRAFT_160028 [Selaginella moellendorffii]EFJ33066.1 hypothetical protein SELMODRAFT_167855 [Selaginella moellendorffii]|eukprot:XP_002965646.1 plastocyanin [Selaginella moellendorffii]
MASSVAASKLAVPTFVGLKAGEVVKPSIARNARPVQHQAPLVCVSSMEGVAKRAGKVMVGVSAGLLLGASSALAASVTVKMGGDDGSLAFIPKNISIGAGDTVIFENNAGFPHNIIFDEDAVPSGVNADALSHPDLLNAPGESYKVTLQTKGTYGFYCEPHQGVGMSGDISVN